MFKDNKAFGSFSVSDLQAARKFYEEVLGLEVTFHEIGFLQLQIAASSPVMVYEKKDHTPATFTILNFPVDDVERAVDELIAKGVVFEQYKGQINTNEKGINTHESGAKIAWFKDPSGNILSVLQEM